MIGFSTICCFPVDIAVRLIGSISLLMNVLVFIALVSNPGEVLADDKIRIIFGFDSEYFNPDNQSRDDAEWFTIFCLIFTLFLLISSALLIWASIVGQRWLTVPWLICSLLNLTCHITSLTLLSFREVPAVREWVTALTVLHSVALFYFTLIVAISHYLWWIQSKQQSTESPDQELRESVPKSTYFNRQLVEAPSLMSI
ncbi:hypothetical protein RUM44_009245 [Polyplax serrata]|uniref:Uncharacterized protein n=1 Tax=Polyplax serrata TaxID=468196 RepID=A0ABR1ATN0_POLSC